MEIKQKGGFSRLSFGPDDFYFDHKDQILRCLHFQSGAIGEANSMENFLDPFLACIQSREFINWRNNLLENLNLQSKEKTKEEKLQIIESEKLKNQIETKKLTGWGQIDTRALIEKKEIIPIKDKEKEKSP